MARRVETRLAGRILERRLAAQVNREATGIGHEDVGLSLEEGKTVVSAKHPPTDIRNMVSFPLSIFQTDTLLLDA